MKSKFPKPVLVVAEIVFPLALIALISWGLWAALDIYAEVAVSPANPLAQLAQHEIDSNVPDPEDFDLFLTRDLESYFSDLRGSNVAVSYELLREGPSQSGIAYPKYYAWVVVTDGSSWEDEGVVRVAAVGRTEFDVTDYFSEKDLRRVPPGGPGFFAEDISAKIEAKLR